MAWMDDTQVAEMLEKLAGMNPADAAETAERLAEMLADRLEERAEDTA
ncbi:hypothetical protein BMS3Abin02_00119 [bacterium BMS3Abin02]|nr:hypothetical protein BMS3Abin02_00119 [bacterium BMS3Abin02]GBE21973.1 hypothetical protein BMS3Bbin01_01327 [bacterium BMS3Bbin01]